jgi:hypothetical protein
MNEPGQLNINEVRIVVQKFAGEYAEGATPVETLEFTYRPEEDSQHGTDEHR